MGWDNDSSCPSKHLVDAETMIMYDGFAFSSAPKTGVAWFLKAAQLAGLGPGFRDKALSGFSGTPRTMLKVSLMRHPYEWLKAFHCSRGFGNHLGPLDCLSSVKNGYSFDSWVEYYLNHLPGKISELILSYDADSYIRRDDLPGAFVELAKSIGVELGMMAHPFFHARPPADYDRLLGDNPKLRRRVADVDCRLMELGDFW